MATRKLIVEIVGDSASLSRSFRGASAESKTLGGSIGKLSISLGQLVKGTLVVDGFQKALQGLHATVGLGINEFVAQQKVAVQTAAVLKSTGGAANVSAQQIDGLALSLSNLSGQTKPAIQSAENALLAFTNIRNFAGKGNDIFTEATKAVVDFSARTGRDATQAATLFGRALQDPASRVGSLSRAGVVLTSSQTSAIKALQKTSGVVAAQRLLISDLTTRYHGAAEAAGNTVPGQLNKLKNALSEVAGEIVGQNVPGFEGLLAVGVKWIQNADNQERIVRDVQRALHDFGAVAHEARDVLEDVIPIVKGVNTALGGTKNILETLVALKVSSSIAGWANALGKFGGSATVAAAGTTAVKGEVAAVGSTAVVAGAEVGGLRTALLGIGAPEVLLAIAAVGAAFEAAHLTQNLSKKVFGETGFTDVGITSAGQKITVKNGKFTAATFLDPNKGITLGGEISEAQAAKLLGISVPELEKRLGAGSVKVRMKALTLNPLAALNVTSLKVGNADDGVPGVPGPPPKPGLTASQRNTFFDNSISSALTRAGLLTDMRSQISALQNVAALISQRIAKTKDVTRLRTLEDQLLQVQSQISGDRLQVQAQAASEFLASLQLGITKAQATASFKDDIAAFTALENGIKAQIKATGDTADLESQLFDAQQGLKNARASAASAKTSALVAKDFKALGLGPTGDALIPGKAHLKKLLQSVVDSISGTSLDTSKIRSKLAVIRDELTQAFVPPEIRTEMQSMLADIEGQLKKAGSQLGFKQIDTSAFVKSLGLTGDAARRAQGKLSQLGKGGTVPNKGVGAFGVAASTGAGAGGPRGFTITPSTVVVKVNENEIGRASMNWKIGHDRRNPSQRRGPNAGK